MPVVPASDRFLAGNSSQGLIGSQYHLVMLPPYCYIINGMLPCVMIAILRNAAISPPCRHLKWRSRWRRAGLSWVGLIFMGKCVAVIAFMTLFYAGTVQATDMNSITALRESDVLGIKITVRGDTLIIEDDGAPNHATGQFPMMRDNDGNARPDNPNRIEKQNYRFEMALHPKRN